MVYIVVVMVLVTEWWKNHPCCWYHPPAANRKVGCDGIGPAGRKEGGGIRSSQDVRTSGEVEALKSKSRTAVFGGGCSHWWRRQELAGTNSELLS